MTLDQKTNNTFTVDNIQNNLHSSGIDEISLIIVILCCVLILIVILTSIVNCLRKKRSIRLQDEQIDDNGKTDAENYLELEVKTEQKKQQNSNKNGVNTIYSRQENKSAKTDGKDSSQIDRISDRSNSVSTSREL